MLAPLLSCVLPLRLPRQPASVFHDVRQWCCWPVPGINRKAAAIFQQQAAGLTGYAINTELTAGIGPSTVAPLSAIRAPPDVMVTPVALPPQTPPGFRRHPPVFSALNGLPVHPGDRRTPEQRRQPYRFPP